MPSDEQQPALLTAADIERVRANFAMLRRKPESEWQIIDLSYMASLGILYIPRMLATLDAHFEIVEAIASEAAAICWDVHFGYRCAFCEAFVRQAEPEDDRTPEPHAPDCLVTKAHAVLKQRGDNT